MTLLEGPAVTVGCVGGALAGALVARAVGGLRAPVLAGAGAALLAGAVGALDDLVGDAGTKGLRGHLGALRRGRVTTGALKIAGLAGAGALVSATGGPPGLGALAVDAAVVAGSANLVNLLDLRPGRALKVVVALGSPLLAAGSPVAGAAVGAAAAALPADLAGRRMLGDTGANALGAALGAAAVERLPPRGRLAVLVVLAGLTLASERVSFSRVIDATPVLRVVDRWGRPGTGGGAGA